MNGILIVDGLMLVFTAVILVGLLWLVLRLRVTGPARLQHRINREVAERGASMAAVAATYASAVPAQRERLALNYRYNRAALLALDPEYDTTGTDAVIAAVDRAGTQSGDARSASAITETVP